MDFGFKIFFFTRIDVFRVVSGLNFGFHFRVPRHSTRHIHVPLPSLTLDPLSMDLLRRAEAWRGGEHRRDGTWRHRMAQRPGEVQRSTSTTANGEAKKFFLFLCKSVCKIFLKFLCKLSLQNICKKSSSFHAKAFYKTSVKRFTKYFIF